MNYSAKIVRKLDPDLKFSVRIVRDDGIEVDVFETRHLEKAEQWLGHYRPWLLAPGGYALLLVDNFIHRARATNRAVVEADDKQGDPNYATKTHMRGWAAETEKMLRAATQAIADFRLLVVPEGHSDCNDSQGMGEY